MTASHDIASEGMSVSASTRADNPPPSDSSASSWSIRENLQRHALLRRYLACADIVASAVALLLATQIVRTSRLHWTLVLAIALVVPLAKIMGLYDRDELLLRKSTLDEGQALLRLATGITLLAWLLSLILMAGQFHRDQVLAGGC